MLTDLNVRRLIKTIQVKQGTINEGIDLSQYFQVGPQMLPSFGITTEIILPWDMQDEQCLTLLVTLNHSEAVFIPSIH